MAKTLHVIVSVLNRYVFEMEVPDNYDENEKYIIASDYFENLEDQSKYLKGGDFQVDRVEETAP